MSVIFNSLFVVVNENVLNLQLDSCVHLRIFQYTIKKLSRDFLSLCISFLLSFSCLCLSAMCRANFPVVLLVSKASETTLVVNFTTKLFTIK